MTLRLRDVRVSHGTTVLVDVAGVDLEPGSPVTIVGESGSGKSLLAQALMGTLPAGLTVSGTVDGSPLADVAARRAAWSTTLAMLPQEPVLALDPTMRALGAVSEGSRSFVTSRATARASARALLDRLGVGHAADAYPHQLSGGMAQRVAFAATTIGGSPVLVADEPSTGLDEVARDELAALLLDHVAREGSLLSVTHDLSLARALGGQVVVMRASSVVESGPVAAVLSTPSHAWTRALLTAEPAAWARRTTPPAGAPLVTATSVTRSFGGPSLFEMSVTIGAGERVALSGPSGSGKTTLGNVLLRLLPPTSGTVEHAPGLAGRVQRLHQDPVVSFPARVPLRTGLGDLLRRRRLPDSALDDLLEATGVSPSVLTRRPGQLSGGELQRVAIARAMLTEPLLLLADEATSRLDLLSQATTASVLLDQVDRHGTALVWITHDRDLADAVATRTVAVGRRPTGVRGPRPALSSPCRRSRPRPAWRRRGGRRWG